LAQGRQKAAKPKSPAFPEHAPNRHETKESAPRTKGNRPMASSFDSKNKLKGRRLGPKKKRLKVQALFSISSV
jgi:hypothetical protein